MPSRHTPSASITNQSSNQSMMLWIGFEIVYCLILLVFGFAQGFIRAYIASNPSKPSSRDLLLAGLSNGIKLTSKASLRATRLVFGAQGRMTLRKVQTQYKGVVNVQETSHGIIMGHLQEPGQDQDSPDAVILFVHGGAMVSGGPSMHAQPLADIIYQMRLAGVKVKLWALSYPLSPEHVYPEAKIKVARALQWLLCGNDPSTFPGVDWNPASNMLAPGNTSGPAVMLMGDSAGGNLALTALLSLDPPSRGPIPIGLVAPSLSPIAGMVLISPWVDLASPWSSTNAAAAGVITKHVYPCTSTEPQPPPAGKLPCECVQRQLKRLQIDFLNPASLARAAGAYVAGLPGVPTKADPSSLVDAGVSPAYAFPHQTAASLRAFIHHLPILVPVGEDEAFLPDIVKWTDDINKNNNPVGVMKTAVKDAAAAAKQQAVSVAKAARAAVGETLRMLDEGALAEELNNTAALADVVAVPSFTAGKPPVLNASTEKDVSDGVVEGIPVEEIQVLNGVKGAVKQAMAGPLVCELWVEPGGRHEFPFLPMHEQYLGRVASHLVDATRHWQAVTKTSAN